MEGVDISIKEEPEEDTSSGMWTDELFSSTEPFLYSNSTMIKSEQVDYCMINQSSSEDEESNEISTTKLNVKSECSGRFPCKFCPIVWNFASELALHEASSHSRTFSEASAGFNCARCSFKGSSREEYLSHHLKIHLKLEPPSSLQTPPGITTPLQMCPICNFNCESQLDLISHMTTHSSQDFPSLECPVCHEKLKSRLYFNRHMKVHLNPTSSGGILCDQCGKSFNSNSLLELHKEFHKDPSKWRWKCSSCGKPCSTKQSLQVHLRTHTGEKPFVCDVCGEKFGYRHVLRAHVNQKHDNHQDKPRIYTKNSQGPEGSHLGRRKHIQNSQFQCDKCSKHFSTKQALQVHGRLHTGEMPFTCQACGESFRYRQFLRDHVNDKHADEGLQDKPRSYRKNDEKTEKTAEDKEEKSGRSSKFRCDQCSKLFSTKQALQVHSRIHTGEKPFKCESCGESFRYRQLLRSHVQAQHRGVVEDTPRPYNKKPSFGES